MGMKNIDTLVTFGIDPRGARDNGAQAQNLYKNALAEIRATPGVTAAGFSVVPLLNDQGLEADWRIISGDEPFFQVTKSIGR